MLLLTPHHRRNRGRYVLYALTFLVIVYLRCPETSAPLDYARIERSQGSDSNPTPPPNPSPSPFVGQNPGEPRILLVSAFFPLPKSKHTLTEYRSWLSNFLGQITTPIYFYAPPSLVPTILEVRKSLPIYINTTYASPFDIPPLQGLRPAYNHLHTFDREAFRHNPDLYAVWNAKPWFLNSAVQHARERGEEYEFAFWCDAGSFRHTHAYEKWPDPGRIDEIWNDAARKAEKKEDMLFFPFTGTYSWLKRYWRESDGPVDAEISEGSFFGGSATTVSWWSQVYYTYHDYYLRRGLFVGKDQTLINALFLLFPSRFFGVWLTDPSVPSLVRFFDSGPMGACGYSWFYYQFFLASNKERELMRGMWMGELEDKIGNRWPWKDWKWWWARQECKLARVVWMSDMVSDAFGKGWSVGNSPTIPSDG